MSSGIDIKFVQERYANMSDNELMFLLTNNANGLTPEALEVAKNEIKKRGMNPRFQMLWMFRIDPILLKK